MKRYFRIAFNLFLSSVTPIVGWFLLSIILGDKQLSNTFSLTYPLQFIGPLLLAFFVTGSTVRSNKEQNKNATFTGLLLGNIAIVIVFSICAVFTGKYIEFMHMDVETFKIFGLYVIIQFGLYSSFNMLMEKLYFEGKEKRANLLVLFFNLINFVCLVVTALITKNQIIIICVALVALLIYVVVLYILNFEKFKFDFKPLLNFKYCSSDILEDILYFCIYLFGFSNAFQFGPEYITAINFAALITDPMWDASNAIGKIAAIDISNNEFNFKKSLKHSAILCGIFLAYTFTFIFALFKPFEVNLNLALIALIPEIAWLVIYPFEANMSQFIQLEHSPLWMTIVTLSSDVVRLLLSTLIYSPFCTQIGQFANMVGLFTFELVIFFVYYKVDKTTGALARKETRIKKAE